MIALDAHAGNNSDSSCASPLETLDSGEKRTSVQLPLEARHSISLEVARQRRQRVATSIFIPKDIRLMTQRYWNRSWRKRKLLQQQQQQLQEHQQTQQQQKKPPQLCKAPPAEKQRRRRKKKHPMPQHPDAFPLGRSSQALSGAQLRHVVNRLKAPPMDEAATAEEQAETRTSTAAVELQPNEEADFLWRLSVKFDNSADEEEEEAEQDKMVVVAESERAPDMPDLESSRVDYEMPQSVAIDLTLWEEEGKEQQQLQPNEEVSVLDEQHAVDYDYDGHGVPDDDDVIFCGAIDAPLEFKTEPAIQQQEEQLFCLPPNNLATTPRPSYTDANAPPAGHNNGPHLPCEDILVDFNGPTESAPQPPMSFYTPHTSIHASSPLRDYRPPTIASLYTTDPTKWTGPPSPTKPNHHRSQAPICSESNCNICRTSGAPATFMPSARPHAGQLWHPYIQFEGIRRPPRFLEATYQQLPRLPPPAFQPLQHQHPHQQRRKHPRAFYPHPLSWIRNAAQMFTPMEQMFASSAQQPGQLPPSLPPLPPPLPSPATYVQTPLFYSDQGGAPYPSPPAYHNSQGPQSSGLPGLPPRSPYNFKQPLPCPIDCVYRHPCLDLCTPQFTHARNTIPLPQRHYQMGPLPPQPPPPLPAFRSFHQPVSQYILPGAERPLIQPPAETQRRFPTWYQPPRVNLNAMNL